MKKLSFILVAILGMMGCINQTQAQSASFSNIRLEHNVPSGDGRTVLQFHYTMTVNGALGHKVHAVMFVDIPRGVGHHFADGKVMMAESTTVNCTLESIMTTGDWWVGIYTDMLNPWPGNYTYYTRLGAWDETIGQYIGWSDFLEYSMVGQTNMQDVASGTYIIHSDGSVYHWGDPVPNTPIDNSGTYIEYPDGTVYHWGDGVVDDYSSDSRSDRHKSSSHVKCHNCNGTGRVPDDVTKANLSNYGTKKPRMGKCSECGQTVNLDVHTHKTCPVCHGTGYR